MQLAPSLTPCAGRPGDGVGTGFGCRGVGASAAFLWAAAPFATWCSRVWVALQKKKSESDGGTPTIVCSRDVAPRLFVQHVHALEMESWMRREESNVP